MKRFKLDYLKKSSIHITPNIHDSSTKSYKYSLFRAAGYVVLYTLIAWLVLIFFLAITPLKDFLFVLDNEELKVQKERINELQVKVNLLTNQLQSIVTTDEKIKYAVMLAKKDSLKSTDALYDTLRNKINKKLKIGGNIFLVFQNIYKEYFEDGKGQSKIIFLEPVDGVITLRFNPAEGHFGIDYGLKTGTPVYSSAGGVVLFSDYTIDYGYILMIEHDQNFITIYKHCSSLLKKSRDIVKQGELIALSGNSGKNTTGPHLHFEIWQNGKPIDPEKITTK